ncbi:hypothetical protein BC342_05050 [Streptomyces olivaceus]|nr:hypothetical protein BC342_05050 [Streptomyces olivaceus]
MTPVDDGSDFSRMSMPFCDCEPGMVASLSRCEPNAASPPPTRARRSNQPARKRPRRRKADRPSL